MTERLYAARLYAVRIPRRTVLTIAAASFLGLVAFLWPFVLPADRVGSSGVSALMFGALLVLVVAVVVGGDGLEHGCLCVVGLS